MSLRSSSPQNGVTFSQEGETGLITAVDERTGATASGQTRGEAIVALGEILVLREGGGDIVEDLGAFDREFDVPYDEADSIDPPWL